ncbi:hypothetical protein Tco_1481127 [Tanacetum coccineum]
MQHLFIINTITLQSIHNNNQFLHNHSYLLQRYKNLKLNFLSWTLVSLFLHFSKERIRLTASTKKWHSYLLSHQGFHLQTINSERLPILKIRQPFQMEESHFNKFKEDKLRVLLALKTEELLQPQGETIQLVKQSSAWFKEKLMLAKAQEADLSFQTEDLDAYDSDCDDISSAKVVLMENLSSCDSDVLSEQYHSLLSISSGITKWDTNSSAPNDLLVLSLVKQMTDHVAKLDKENQTNKMVNESLTAELERYKERVAIFEQRLNVDLNKHERLIDSQIDDLIRNINAKFAAFQ